MRKIITADAWRMVSLDEALSFLEGGVLPGPALDDLTRLMLKCRTKRELGYAQRLHAYLRESRLETHTLLGNHLVTMLVAVGSMHDAQQVFDRLTCRNERSWNSLIAGFNNCGKPQSALTLYQKMLADDSIHPNGHTLASSLKACATLKDLETGLEIHERAANVGLLERDLFVGSSLVDMYIKCGLLLKAHNVFEMLPIRNAVSWTALIVGYVEHGYGQEALNCFENMQLEGVRPDSVTLTSCLRACTNIRALNRGRDMHAEIERQCLLRRDSNLGNTLVDMYAKCGALSMAQQVFEKLPIRDTVSWTALIAGYAEHGTGVEALECLKKLQTEGIFPDTIALICSLKACGSMKDVDKGLEIHCEFEKRGLLETNVIAGNTLVDMYAKCGLLSEAQEIFGRIPARSAVSWNALIEGYAEQAFGEKAVDLYEKMQSEGITADEATFVSGLKACRSMTSLKQVEKIHTEMERQGFLEKSIAVGNMLVEIYANSGFLGKAQEVFDKLQVKSTVAWNTLIEGYAEHGFGEEALDCLAHMQLEGVLPDTVTFVCGLKACASIGAIEEGEEIHAEIERRRLLESNLVIGNTLVDMYVRCGSMSKAQEVFDRIPSKDVVSWNILIAGYAEHGCSELAINFFQQMQVAGVSPDAVSFISGLKACGNRGAAENAEEIHGEIERQGLLEKDVVLGSSLVDMYAKCGSLSKAQQVLDKIPATGNVVPWNALMSGYTQIGESESVVLIFERMLGQGMKPSPITFVLVLAACSRTGLFYESKSYYQAMSEEFGIVPLVEHQTCLVDAFCRSGSFEQGVAIIEPSWHSSDVWHSVLGACKHWGNVDFGKKAFVNAVCLDAKDSSAYALMSQIYAGANLKV